MDERGIQIAAHRLMDIYGEDVFSRIAECIEEALMHGQGEIYGIWCRIQGVIDDWQITAPDATTH